MIKKINTNLTLTTLKRWAINFALENNLTKKLGEKWEKDVRYNEKGVMTTYYNLIMWEEDDNNTTTVTIDLTHGTIEI